MVAICWDHWCPTGWTRLFPFEVFLFFFLVLSGYLITGSLLRDRARHEAKGGAWKISALKNYQLRRGLRILIPYYIALVLALLAGAPDLRDHFAWYFLHLSNFHMAMLPHWPPATNHFWSLSIQQQFYLIWPFVIWFAPRKWMVLILLSFTVVGPISRFYHNIFQPYFASPQLLTWMAFDYFGIGGLLALAVHRQMSWSSSRLKWLWGMGLLGYVGLMVSHHLGFETGGFRALQQTFLGMALCGMIAAGSQGMTGWGSVFLENAGVQKIGQLSYGIYLFHNLAPLVAGKLCWFLWSEPFMTPYGAWLRIVVFAAVTWGLASACWKWIESPLQEVRARLRPHSRAG